jgi:hypothetical protein
MRDIDYRLLVPGLVLERALHDPRQVFPSVGANNVANAGREVKHTSLGQRALDEFFNVVTTVPVRKRAYS